jgi:hypothetical protein
MLRVYREDRDGNIIRGVGLPAFIHNLTYHQTIIEVYEDGIIDCWGLVTLEEFKRKVSQGWVVTQIPEGGRIHCHHLYDGYSNLKYFVKIEEFIKEVEDTINRLQKKKTVKDICLEAFSVFLLKPTPKNRRKLQKAYEDIPEHLRCYILGDMDDKDSAIRSCIYNKNIPVDVIEYSKNRYDLLFKETP